MNVATEFRALFEQPDGPALDRGAALVAAAANHASDPDAVLARLDRIAESVAPPTLDGLRRLLFGELGFRGAVETYDDPSNSYLDHVLDRREGIPILLSVVAIEVGRRSGVPLAGVGLPGHFIVRDKVDPNVFVDPFAGGVLLDTAAVESRFRQMHGPGAPFDASYLEPVDSTAILVRILANLRGSFARRGDRASLEWVLHLLVSIPEPPVGIWAEYATILGTRGRFIEAAKAFEAAAEDPRIPPETAARHRSAAIRARARVN